MKSFEHFIDLNVFIEIQWFNLSIVILAIFYEKFNIDDYSKYVSEIAIRGKKLHEGIET